MRLRSITLGLASPISRASSSMNSSLAKAGQPRYSRRHAESRLEPHRERLGEILGGMGLRIPRTEVLHEAAAARTRPVGVRIGERCRPENLAPAAAAPQPIGRVDRVARLVAQDAHQPVAVAAFDFAHEAPLDAHEAAVRQIERDGDSRDAVRREPFLRQPAMRPEADAARGELAVKPLDRLARDRCLRWSVSNRKSAG